MIESVEQLKRRKHTEAETLACGKAALWARVEKLARPRDLTAALSDGAVVRVVVGPPPGTLPEAAAYAVVTDPVEGGRGIAGLTAWRERSDAPLIWWDHVVDPVQIAEARSSGADAVRITLALVDDLALDDCLTAAERAGCAAIVVVSGDQEASRAISMGADIVAARGHADRAAAWRQEGAVLVLDIVRADEMPGSGVDAVVIEAGG